MNWTGEFAYNGLKITDHYVLKDGMLVVFDDRIFTHVRDHKQYRYLLGEYRPVPRRKGRYFARVEPWPRHRGQPERKREWKST